MNDETKEPAAPTTGEENAPEAERTEPTAPERLTPQQKLFFLLVIVFALFLVFLKLFLERKMNTVPEPAAGGTDMENPYSEDFNAPIFSLPPALTGGGDAGTPGEPTYGPEPEPE